MENEIWKDISNYEGLYQISNLGRVKSLKRKCIKQDFLLKLLISKSGYYVVNLSKLGNQKIHTVHVLLAIAFLNHKPDGFRVVVDHINNNKLDNRIENIQLISNRENSSKDTKNKKRSSIYVGVCWDCSCNKWLSRIRVNGKLKYLGKYNNEIDASIRYQEELKTLLTHSFNTSKWALTKSIEA